MRDDPMMTAWAWITLATKDPNIDAPTRQALREVAARLIQGELLADVQIDLDRAIAYWAVQPDDVRAYA